MTATTALLDELAWRGLLHQQTEGLGAALAAGPVRGYCGFDPTASSLHVGNLVPIMGLVHLQRAGHRPVALVGGGTGLIGDPSGRTAERLLHSEETVAANVAALRTQLERFLDFDGERGARLVDNGDWLRGLDLVGFLRDVGKHFTVNYMLAKESVQSRLSTETGISFTEFSYMLLQAYDFAELARREDVTLQLGGSDQWGNMTAGVSLVRKMLGSEAHALTMPLVTTASGTKFGKSEAGAVWLDAERTSPYAFYQFWMNTDDRDVGTYLRYFTLLDRNEIVALEQASESEPAARGAQRRLAQDVTTRVHGAEAARAAEEVSGLLFDRGDPGALSEAALELLQREVPFATIAADHETRLPNGTLDVLALLVASGVAASRGAAKRLLEQGGVSVNGTRLASDQRAVSAADSLRGGHFLLRKGARDYALVRVVS